MKPAVIRNIRKLGFPWVTQDPFLFCVHHLDFYPAGNENLGPEPSLLKGRNIGSDFEIQDGWRMYHGASVPGFPVHPHRGFETVTFVLQGLVDHADSNGSAGRYGNGDVQWMTAGSGLQHSEMFPLLNSDKPNTCELFQIWLNLPADKKMVTPDYKMLWSETIPKAVFNDAEGHQTAVEIIAGSYDNKKAPAPASQSWASNPENEVCIWQIKMDAGASWLLPAATQNVNRSLYFFEGESVSIEESTFTPNHVFELDARHEIVLINGRKPSRFLLLQGKPIAQPVAQYGPFVMNNMEEIRKAFEDFQRTEFGGWPWPRRDMVYGKDRGRFSLFANGEEVIKDA